MKRALISVTNKDGVVDFAKGLVELGFEIVSTGGTMKVLQENGVSCIAIDDVTGFPEMLDGRVKTLHPMVHGGLLYRRDLPSHVETIKTSLKFLAAERIIDGPPISIFSIISGKSLPAFKAFSNSYKLTHTKSIG